MPTLDHDVIEQQIANIVRAMGSSASEAQTVAHNLVLYNLK
jgi:LDH2 family malate/lactate/ureidoglycolate dehydrogenase